MLRYKPDPIHILVVIGKAVALAGGTLYVGLLLLWMRGNVANAFGTPQSIHWILTLGSTALLTAYLWRHSGQRGGGTTVLRLTYALGLALVFGWWLGILLFVFV